MIRKIFNLFRKENPDEIIGSQLSLMMRLAEELIVEAGNCLFEGCAEVDRDAFYAKDRRINELQQEIRKQLVGRLELSTAIERARFLVIAGLIKDVERLGDYAKNLLQAAELLGAPFPEGEETAFLKRIRAEVEDSLRLTHSALETLDTQQARSLIERGHSAAAQCERLVQEVTNSSLSAGIAVPLALSARHYKRIQKHLMNALSTLIMPLHKVDYAEEIDYVED